MARSIWSGSISFGLVNIPIKVFSATQSHRVAFHEFEVSSGQRIHNKRVAEKSGREVSWAKIGKGFEVAKGRYVMLTDEELQTAEPKKTNTIELEQFVDLTAIDPVSFDQTYYVGPDGSAALKAYALLREAMADNRRVGIGRFVMRTKEYLACIRPLENILALQTMFFPDEVRSTTEVGEVPKKVAVGQREKTMAGQLIESLTAPWDPTKYEDTFRQRVMEIVRKKDKGEAIVTGGKEEGEGEGKVLDLMAALKATLERPRGSSAKARGAGRARSKTRTTTGTTTGTTKANSVGRRRTSGAAVQSSAHKGRGRSRRRPAVRAS